VKIAPGPENPISRNVAGIGFDGFEPPSQLDLTSKAGVNWVRYFAIRWDEIQPSPNGEYRWNKVDEAGLKNAAERGLTTIAIIHYAPEWAREFPSAACGPVASEALPRLTLFVRKAVERYRQPPFNLKYWEFWNEPDAQHGIVPGVSPFGCWGDPNLPFNGGSKYGQMLRAVYPAVKAVDASARVLIGGLLLDCDPANPPETTPGSVTLRDCSTARFLEGVLKAGAGEAFDGISFHAYDYYSGDLGGYSNPNWHSTWNTTGPALIAKARYLRSLLVGYGYPDKVLINTEMAMLCGRDGSEPTCVTEAHELTKSYYLMQANAAAVAEGLDGNLWYSLTGWRGSGLASYGELIPNQTYTALQVSTAMLKGAKFVGELTGAAGVAGYAFDRDDRRLWVVWARDGKEHLIRLPEAPAAALDPFGAPQQAGVEITVGLQPIYLEWPRK
jgi:hypothetical protein